MANGRHLVVADKGGAHRIWLTDPTPGRQLAVLIPIDATFDLRAAATLRLWRRLTGAADDESPSGLRPTAFQRRRLALLLAVLDAHLARATLQDMAIHLVYPGMARLRAIAWKDSPERRRTRRLVDEAIALMRDGYRRLLSGS